MIGIFLFEHLSVDFIVACVKYDHLVTRMKKAIGTVKNTFINLPEEKRQRIVDVSVEEFAAHGYRKASLNMIVKRLGIAKGSLYQYFANKEALFVHVFDTFTELVRKTVKMARADGQVNFFTHTEKVMQAGVIFIDRFPQYYQIYLRVLFEQDVPRREELISRVRLFSAAYFAPLCDQAKNAGMIRTDISTETIIFLLDSVIDRFLQAYAGAGGNGLDLSQKKNPQTEMNALISLLKNGISV